MGLIDRVRRGSDASSHSKDGSGDSSSSFGSPGNGEGGGGNGASPNDTEVLDKEEGNLLMSMISQLRIGMDLHKIAFPTFVLEPRSLLERITDFMAHPEFIFGAGTNPDAKERFLSALTFYLAGWHIKPRGVKKPYNPVLGEFFRCTYAYADGSKGFYVAEQVSHHPPVSAFFYISPKNGVMITGELKPRSKFLGNSAATLMDGENRITLLQKPEDGEYAITMPNMYARGIVVGKMTLELGDTSTVTCKNTGYACDVEFKTKGWISGGYNAIAGHVKSKSGAVGEIDGHWDSSMNYKDNSTGKKRTIFDAATAAVVPKTVLPEDQQEQNESRRLWAGLTQAIKQKDMNAATEEKSKVEEAQREIARQREAKGESHQLRFFKAVGQKFMPTLDIEPSTDPARLEQMVDEWMFGKSSQGVNASATGAIASAAPANLAQSPTLSARSDDSHSSYASAESIAHPTAPGPPVPGPKSVTPPPNAK